MTLLNTRSPLAMKLSMASDSYLAEVIEDIHNYNQTARRLAKYYQNQRAGKHLPQSRAQHRALLMGQVNFFCLGAAGTIANLKYQLRGLQNTDADTHDAEYLVGCIDMIVLYCKASIEIAGTINRKAIAARLESKESKEIETTNEMEEGKLL